MINFECIPAELIDKITEYNETGLNIANKTLYNYYIKYGYRRFIKLYRGINSDIPQYDENINWNVEYYNLIWYQQYLSLMKKSHNSIVPLDYDPTIEWKDKYHYIYIYVNKFPDFMINSRTYDGLFIGNSNLNVVPGEIGKLVNLSRLDLSYNKLKILPKEIGYLTNLYYFNCKNNLLRSLPPEISNCIKLVEFNCSNNELYILPNSFGKLRQLNELNISDNKIGNN